MTAANVTGGARRWTATWVLGALAVVVVAIALLTPEEPGSRGRDLSTFSTGPGGASIVLELAERMGWKAERRTESLDSVAPARRVDVVLAPSVSLGSHEVHRLLENVRGGGGLIASLDGDDELADSLRVDGGRGVAFLEGSDTDCPDERFSAARLLSMTSDVREVTAPKIPDSQITTLLSGEARGAPGAFRAAIGFPLGAGRVVVVGSSSVFANGAVRYCRSDADLAVARMLAYVRPASDPRPVIAFDEFHHGYGVHGGSLRAAAGYLGRTSSGHFFAQAMVAGLILLLARMPRPLSPREPAQIPRRSPIEHADALGRAFEDVGATRTAISRLLGGIRRRTGRAAGIASGAGDGEFLSAVERLYPSLADPIQQIRNALDHPVPPEQFVGAGNALDQIERALVRDQSLSRHQ
jgi:hypothetical protein